MADSKKRKAASISLRAAKAATREWVGDKKRQRIERQPLTAAACKFCSSAHAYRAIADICVASGKSTTPTQLPAAIVKESEPPLFGEEEAIEALDGDDSAIKGDDALLSEEEPLDGGETLVNGSEALDGADAVADHDRDDRVFVDGEWIYGDERIDDIPVTGDAVDAESDADDVDDGLDGSDMLDRESDGFEEIDSDSAAEWCDVLDEDVASFDKVDDDIAPTSEGQLDGSAPLDGGDSVIKSIEADPGAEADIIDDAVFDGGITLDEHESFTPLPSPTPTSLWGGEDPIHMSAKSLFETMYARYGEYRFFVDFGRGRRGMEVEEVLFCCKDAIDMSPVLRYQDGRTLDKAVCILLTTLDARVVETDACLPDDTLGCGVVPPMEAMDVLCRLNEMVEAAAMMKGDAEYTEMVLAMWQEVGGSVDFLEYGQGYDVA